MSNNVYLPFAYPFRILAEGQVHVVTAGTPVALPSNADAKAVRIFNNDTTLTPIFYHGLNATVDALSSPPIGEPIIPLGRSCDITVEANSNEVYIDSTVSNTYATYHILG